MCEKSKAERFYSITLRSQYGQNLGVAGTANNVQYQLPVQNLHKSYSRCAMSVRHIWWDDNVAAGVGPLQVHLIGPGSFSNNYDNMGAGLALNGQNGLFQSNLIHVETRTAAGVDTYAQNPSMDRAQLYNNALVNGGEISIQVRNRNNVLVGALTGYTIIIDFELIED